jgi:two-component system OmpR family sensor kinase
MKQALKSSSQEVDRLTQLAEHLLLIARADRGRLALQVEPLDASKLLEGVVTRFSWRAEEAGRRLAVDVPNRISVQVDRVRVEQALGNLVDNALRHGEGEVKLSAASAGGAVELHVTDEGRGFPPGFVDEAFERFARSDQARSQGGSGLGLSIVRAVVEAHGGTVQAANRPGGGTDVWIVLPAAGH